MPRAVSLAGLAWKLLLLLTNRFLQPINVFYDYIPVHSTQLQLPFKTVLHAAADGFHLAQSTFLVHGAAETGNGLLPIFTIHIIINIEYYYYIKCGFCCQPGAQCFCSLT